MDEYLEVLKKFFIIVAEANLVLDMEKSSLFKLEILWCVTVADLQQFIFATNWLHDSLPDYTRVIAPLHGKLEAEKKHIGRRNRSALQVAITWTQEVCGSYQQVYSLVKDSALMSHPDPDEELCVFTDASLFGFSIVVTQVMTWQQCVPVEKQNHWLVICKGGMFKHSQLNWTVVEKEVFPIVKACNDLEYLLLRPHGFRLFCDHANLIFISPHDELKKHVRDRLQRWAMRLCGLHYHIEHIADDTNVWADIVSRWHVREAESLSVATVRIRGRHVVPVKELSALRPMMDANFAFPTLEGIAEAQSTAGRERAGLQVDGLEEDVVLGHRGQDAMSFALKDRFFIIKLEDKIAQFIRQCLLCKPFKGPQLIPRPYGPLLTSTERNEVVHWDFLSLGDCYSDATYLLVVKDGLFTGLPASSALDVAVAPVAEEADEHEIKLGDMDDHLEPLRTSLQEIHSEVVGSKEKKRLLDMQAHKGRLKFYADAALNTTEEIMELVSSQGMLLGVDKFIEHRYNQELGRWELLVSWLGLQAIENSWRPLSTLLQDVPVKVREYVNASGTDELCAQLD
ncbi:Hypothetical protein PHPALM_8493 [Phytophthora palmivora]|uniref:Chromo domain-containing protein n=1 Tax=Phytophthora palmivora TaxID=4796 RepID=A0A2P4Y9N7_9STRA|nr:Hypothetical protein PHPALM_8493 [Phytophthora palmivora]